MIQYLMWAINRAFRMYPLSTLFVGGEKQKGRYICTISDMISK